MVVKANRYNQLGSQRERTQIRRKKIELCFKEGVSKCIAFRDCRDAEVVCLAGWRAARREVAAKVELYAFRWSLALMEVYPGLVQHHSVRRETHTVKHFNKVHLYIDSKESTVWEAYKEDVALPWVIHIIRSCSLRLELWVNIQTNPLFGSQWIPTKPKYKLNSSVILFLDSLLYLSF